MFQIKKLHIQNFRGIEYETINFWKNKTVFVWKNGSWKTTILKALEKLFNSKKIKRKDFKKPKKKLILEVNVWYKKENIHLIIEAHISVKWEIIIKKVNQNQQIKSLIKKIQLVYIPSDRKINKENKENWYIKLIDLILKNKEANRNIKLKLWEKINLLNANTWRKKTNLLITLLRLYLYSINETNNNDFTIFIIDQPENFLHPHATKMLDSIIQQIWELENTQVFYSTHSPDLVSNFRKWKYEISDIVFVKHQDWKTTAKKIDNSYGKFNKIMINLIFKNASIFFSDKVILVEWETEKISIPNIYETTNWNEYIDLEHKNLSPELKQNYFNLDYKNISIIDVGGKWALYEWFTFASELFWKENVIALIDRDNNFEIDEDMIIKSIKKVYQTWPIYQNDFKKYNWIVLDWEFENYYKIEAVRTYLSEVIKRRAIRNFWENLSQEKLNQSLYKLESKLKTLKKSKKISTTYESIFSSYFRKYSKPTIAFNLSIWLSQNNWYDKSLLKIFWDIIEKFEYKKK